MQQAELLEILPELKQKVELYNRYGTTEPTERDISIWECRQYNLKLKAEQERKRDYWRRVQAARAYNLALRQEQEDIKILEMVKTRRDVLSTIR